jgi:hypothetical protein
LRESRFAFVRDFQHILAGTVPERRQLSALNNFLLLFPFLCFFWIFNADDSAFP